jgi:hypothetical protein
MQYWNLPIGTGDIPPKLLSGVWLKNSGTLVQLHVTDAIESLGVSPLIDVLETLGLPAALPSSNTTENFNLTKTLAMIQYHFTISDLIVTVGFGAHPQNESRKMLLVCLHRFIYLNTLTVFSLLTSCRAVPHMYLVRQIVN